MTIEGISITTKLKYNINTNYISINNTFKYSKNYRDSHKEKIKTYYELHKNEISVYQKNYYNLHKNEIKTYKKNYYNLYKNEINFYQKNYNKSHTKIRFLSETIISNLPKLKSGWVYHHIIYDHLNKDSYIVMMSRSKHTYLHNIMRRDNIELPHINVRINDIYGF